MLQGAHVVLSVHAGGVCCARTNDGVAGDQRLQLLLSPVLGPGRAQRDLDEAAASAGDTAASAACLFMNKLKTGRRLGKSHASLWRVDPKHLRHAQWGSKHINARM